MDFIKADMVFDAKGLVVPIAMIKTRKSIDRMKQGEILEVITTDPEMKPVISMLVDRLGHELLDSRMEESNFKMYIMKK